MIRGAMPFDLNQIKVHIAALSEKIEDLWIEKEVGSKLVISGQSVSHETDCPLEYRWACSSGQCGGCELYAQAKLLVTQPLSLTPIAQGGPSPSTPAPPR
jgi:hypothetical protein